MKCMVDGCDEDALPEPIGVGEIPALGGVIEVDLYACARHVSQWLAGTLDHISIGEGK